MMSARAGGTISAQSTDPRALPRLEFSDLLHLGAFRLPARGTNDTYAFGGKQLAYNPINNSLFVGSRGGRVAEVTIPGAVQSSNPAAMNQASYLQAFFDPTEGNLTQITGEGVALDGLLVQGNRLYGTASIYYDALNQQRISHYSRSLNLSEKSFSGWSRVWDLGKTGYVNGAMAMVPTEWRTLLGGPAVTGQCCIPVVSRTSAGPSAFAFNPANIGQATVAATPLLYYTLDHATLGNWNASSPTYGSTTFMGGMAVIAGTRTALYFGTNGVGENCYGGGTSDPSLHGQPAGDGSIWCYDPTSSGKGTHAYPYRYQIWAYDLNDLADVKAGIKAPWDVKPYGVWPLDLPMPQGDIRFGGVGYDAERQLLYVSQLYADQDGYEYRALIHTFQVNAAGGGTSPEPEPAPAPTPVPPPPTTTQPAPTPTNTSSGTTGTISIDSVSTVVSSITLSVSRSSPQVIGNTITFKAKAVGGVVPHEYKWLVNDGNGWQVAKTWSTFDSFAWMPTAPGDRYRISVWARSSGNTADEAEASVSAAYVITPPPSVPVQAVSIAANKIAPQIEGTAITFTATPTGGTNPVQYKWLLYDGSAAWQVLSGWSTSSTFTWTPTAANANYAIRVWARAANNNTDAPQAQADVAFAINPPKPVLVEAVTLAADKAAPQVTGTSITLTANATGGASPVQYKFLLYDGSPTWQHMTGWTTSNAFTWTPTAANQHYAIRVWARGGNSTTDAPEAEAQVSFPIAAPAPVRVSSVQLTANKTAPQLRGTAITLTAAAAGGASPVQYKFLLYDGSPTWQHMTGWTTSNTFTWTPASANADYAIRVWTRSNGSTEDAPEAQAQIQFPITAPVVVPITGVTLTTDRPAPQPAGMGVTLTAKVTGGGVGPYEYRWLVNDGYGWKFLTGWTLPNQYTWTSFVPNPNYFVGVWVRSAGNTKDEPEATMSMPFAIK